jgi:hypothetical protein
MLTSFDYAAIDLLQTLTSFDIVTVVTAHHHVAQHWQSGDA